MTVTQDQLKPCPCCANDALIIPHATTDSIRFYVACINGGCGLRTLKFGTESEAITAWNTRASEDAERPLLERIEKLEAERKKLRELLEEASENIILHEETGKPHHIAYAFDSIDKAIQELGETQ